MGFLRDGLVPLASKLIADPRFGVREGDVYAMLREPPTETWDVVLVDVDVEWRDRSHFFALAARMMRRILVDHANSRRAEKRGGGARELSLDEVIVVSPEIGDDVLSLHEALNELARLKERHARVVELRFFGGLSLEEVVDRLLAEVGELLRRNA